MKKAILFLPLLMFFAVCYAQVEKITNVIYPKSEKTIEANPKVTAFQKRFNNINDSAGRQIGKNLGQKTYTPLVSSNSPFINQNANIGLESQFGEEFASASIGSSGKNWTWGAEVKQPFKEKPKVVSPLSLDGLENGASVKFSLQRNFRRLKSEKDIGKIYEELKTNFYRHK